MVDRLPLADAAARLGVSVPTLRRRIKAGVVRAEKEKTAGGVRLVVLLDAPELSDTPSPAVKSDDAEWLRARVEEQERTIARLTATNARLTEQAGAFQVLIAQAHELARLPETTASREDQPITRRSPDGDQVDHAPAAEPTPAPVDRQAQKRPAVALRDAWRAVLRKIGQSVSGGP